MNHTDVKSKHDSQIKQNLSLKSFKSKKHQVLQLLMRSILERDNT